MAENLRYRQNHQDESYASRDANADARPSQNDPLAELARLIGQNDPFAEFGRGGARAAARPAQETSHEAAAPAPEWLSRGAPAYNDPAGSAAPDPYAAPNYDSAGYDPADYQTDGYGAADAASEPGTAPEPYVDAHGNGAYAQGDSQDDAQPVDPYRMGYDNTYQAAAGDMQADGYYADEATAGAEADESPRERRRGGMMIIAAVVGLALVGTAGAFGYRAFTGGPATGGEPPVIKADPTPSKVTPAKSADAQPNKLIYDRVGEPGQGERVVPREEQPVDVKPAQPVRPIAMAPGASGIAAGALGAAAFPPSVNEPKKVRTMQIRPDQPAGAQAAQTPQPTSASPAARPAPAAVASTEPPARGAAPQPRRNDGPMAIAPQSSTPPARSAAVTPRAPVAASGNYVVQVSSQKTEADAQASYRAMQSRYSKVLNGRDAMIRRVDLGDKGIYYRAQVGPFATADQANALCNDLKAAGGGCIVQRN